MPLGEGDYRYEEVDGWAKLPEGWVFTQVSDAAIDSQGRIYAFTRGKHPIVVFDKAGNFLTSWGYGEFGISPHLVSQSHGIFIDPNDKVYLTDAYQHIVRRYTRLGDMEQEWGTPGVPGVTHYNREYNMPTGVAFAPDGESYYVSDGYGNRCVHHYSKDGKHLKSWGEAGSGPGQFAVVHNIGCDKNGRVLVCDRENSRIQIFDPDGKFMEEWTDVNNPGDVCITADNTIYVAEQGGGGRISVWSPEGELLSRFEDDRAVQSPHGICVDDEGSIYVAEIGMGEKGQRLQKFSRV
ncbi:MAG: peptidyl-alpha-hydroxyglycine alpha-amidating lyase family protein [bacterium]|nr:peptidyl-alpha-hydroxyglycine alpha-amidating lyase family protein [bacterium]